MSEAIHAYVAQLRAQLSGADAATLHDAVADAEEHLSTALEQARASDPGANEAEILPGIIEAYGSPTEIAKAYRDLENRLIPPFAPPREDDGLGWVRRFFGVLGDPRAYAALFFMLFSLITGIVYFTWAVTGMSLSVGFIILIIGLPFFGLFVFSLQGLALVEGRLIEALLGIRMPRRAPTAPAGKGLVGKFKARVTDPRTWTTLFYCLLKLPLGVLSFSVFVTLLTLSVILTFFPVVQYLFDIPIVINDWEIYAPAWFHPFVMMFGFLSIVIVLHLAKFVGRAYGAVAKSMLVRG